MFNPCGCFNFSIDDGARAFAVAELFFAILNMILGFRLAYVLSKVKINFDSRLPAPFLFMEAVYICLTLGLILQGLGLSKKNSSYIFQKAKKINKAAFALMFSVGFALYPVGYKGGYKVVGWIWIGFAAFNVLNFFLVFIGSCMEYFGWELTLTYMYLLYNIYGILIFIAFCTMKSRDRRSRAVQMNSNLDSSYNPPYENTEESMVDDEPVPPPNDNYTMESFIEKDGGQKHKPHGHGHGHGHGHKHGHHK